jgi:hypothetical protein
MRFDAVPVPGRGECATPEVLTSEVAGWVRSEPIRVLVDRFGEGSLPGTGLAEDLAFLDEMSARHWDTRRGVERNQVNRAPFDDAEEELVLAAASALGLVVPAPPRFDEYDHVVLLGGLVRANIWRTEYAAHLLRQGVRTANVVALTAFRELARNKEDRSKDEYALLQLAGLPDRRYECEVVEDCLRRSFSVPELTVLRESEPDAEDNRRVRVAESRTSDQLITLVAASTLDPSGEWRADTAATYKYWAEQVGHVKPKDRILAVTTCIYVPYQHAVALQRLALPYGCVVDTVGIDHELIGNSPAPQVFAGVHYLQELRSAIVAYRRLLGMLEERS